jgi:hypothetical protein
MNWARRHLNWTMILTCLVFSAAISTLVALQMAHPNLIRQWEMVLLPYGLPLLCGAWVLKRKSQSLCWLLVAWTPPGWFVPIALEDRRLLSSAAVIRHAVPKSPASPPTTAGQEMRPVHACLRDWAASLVAGVSVISLVLGFVSLVLCALVMVFMAGYPDDTIGGGAFLLILCAGLYGPAVVLGGGVISGGSTLMLLQGRLRGSSRRRKLGYATMTTCAAMMVVYVVAWTLFFTLLSR